MLLSPKLIIQEKAGQKAELKAGGILGQSISVIPRANSSFRRVKLSGEGRAAIKALELKIEKEADSKQSGYKIIKNRNSKFAGVWMFDRAIHNGFRVLPESLLYTPLANGVRLIECLEGYEGQVWDNGDLIASRWWSAVPTDSQWLSFLRVGPIELEESDVLPINRQKPEIRENLPLYAFDFAKLNEAITPTNIAKTVSIVSIACFGFYAAQLISLNVRQGVIEAKTAQISEETQLVLSKRRRALKTIADVEKYTQLGSDRAIIDVLLDIATVINSQEVFIQQVRFDTESVEVTLSGAPRLPSPELVASLERTDNLSNVRVSEAPQQRYVIQADYPSGLSRLSQNEAGQ